MALASTRPMSTAPIAIRRGFEVTAAISGLTPSSSAKVAGR